MQKCMIHRVIKSLDSEDIDILEPQKTYRELRTFFIVKYPLLLKKARTSSEKSLMNSILAIRRLWMKNYWKSNGTRSNQNAKDNSWNGFKKTRKKSSSISKEDSHHLNSWWKTLITLRTSKCNCKSKLSNKKYRPTTR